MIDWSIINKQQLLRAIKKEGSSYTRVASDKNKIQIGKIYAMMQYNTIRSG